MILPHFSTHGLQARGQVEGVYQNVYNIKIFLKYDLRINKKFQTLNFHSKETKKYIQGVPEKNNV